MLTNAFRLDNFSNTGPLPLCHYYASVTALTPIGTTEELAEVDTDKPLNRFNDAKCDSRGRLWCGTMGPMTTPPVVEPKQGSLYSYDAGTPL